MQLLTTAQIDSVHGVTDSLGLKRLAIIVPLPAAELGRETVMPDGNLLICAPYGARFDPWFVGLHQRLRGMDLSRTPRADQMEPLMLRVPQRLQGIGPRRDWERPVPRERGPGNDGVERRGITPPARIETVARARPEFALAYDLGGES